MDWAAIITPGVVSALIAGFVSITTAVISYRANRKKTKSEIEKMKLEKWLNSQISNWLQNMPFWH